MNVSAISSLTPSVANQTGRKDTAESGSGAAPKPTPAEVTKAAQQFEAILVRQMLAPAIEPMMNGSMGGKAGPGSSGGGVYGYMLTDVLANSVSQGGGLGLASVISRQLSPASSDDET